MAAPRHQLVINAKLERVALFLSGGLLSFQAGHLAEMSELACIVRASATGAGSDVPTDDVSA